MLAQEPLNTWRVDEINTVSEDGHAISIDEATRTRRADYDKTSWQAI
jgi:hypothetical protein